MKTKTAILFESDHFWVSETFEVNLNLNTYSVLIAINKSLDEAKKLIEKLEKHPRNLKYLLPIEDRYQFELIFKKELARQ